ncbi:unnamed protein product [Adineta steineri]|uniref:O(6)-methylguanine-induced apoptosis 2 n=1 Tax=Adineta steineri TaxID=433720 RepID=A0A818KPG3_9BILA|nr:unnamed protein product [Adineta steineri]CAF3557622.1 unnamed protein product [Adineta steineri]CAF3990791.1 unnamed protein product [Adineta steineri]
MTLAGVDGIAKGEVSRKGNRAQSEGTKVQRGFTVCATGVPSIPSPYLTIITSNNEKKGFHQTAKRFQYETTFAPGPGQYDTVRPIDKQLEKTSDSKKGSGGFASKSRREGFTSGALSAPAPTAYNISSKLGTGQHDFNRAKYSSMFQKPIAERPLSSKSSMPAPNQYDVNRGLRRTGKSNNVSAQAAFRSHTKRSVPVNKHFITPAPDTYNVNDAATRTLRPIHQSSFKSTSKRDTFSSKSTNEIPGPADYRPFEKVTEEPQRQIFPRHPYLTISAPAIPPPPDAPFPGPGAYEICGFKEVEKKYMTSAAFVSNTSRWALDTIAAAEQPGPASYTPRAVPKQTFNFNFERKWI